MIKVLLSTTSYQDTPGPHHDLLAKQNFDIHCERGPLSESRMLELAGHFDAFLCGDDEISERVLKAHLPRLRVISKYGIGLDKINVDACTEQRVPVLFTPGVNHTTVAEHAFMLLLASQRNLVESAQAVRQGEWRRLTGHELIGKRIGLFGLGRIGQEMAKRAVAFCMDVHAVNRSWPTEFAQQYGITRHADLSSMIDSLDVLSLHAGLSESTRDIVNATLLAKAQSHLTIVNTARAELVNQADLLDFLKSHREAFYATDVLNQEPPSVDHPLLNHERCLITPHIGSRTFESVPRQAMRATLNLVNYLSGDNDVIQANPWS